MANDTGEWSVLCKPTSDHGAFIDVTRSFNNWLGLWVREDVVEDVLGSLKHHCRSLGVVLADANKEGLDSHLGKHRLLLRSIHMCAIFLKRVAELEVQNSCLSHGLSGSSSQQNCFNDLRAPSPSLSATTA